MARMPMHHDYPNANITTSGMDLTEWSGVAAQQLHAYWPYAFCSCSGQRIVRPATTAGVCRVTQGANLEIGGPRLGQREGHEGIAGGGYEVLLAAEFVGYEIGAGFGATYCEIPEQFPRRGV